MDEHRPAYYAIIPADVRYDDKLPANAKLLYGEISALIGRDGFCFATNPYFAQIYQCSEDSVTRWISALEKNGYIKREIVRDKSGQIVQRKLYLSVSVPDIQPPRKISDTPPQNFREGTCKNAGDTNTSITDIEKENKKRKTQANRTALTEEQLRQHWIDWIKANAPLDWTASGKNDLFFSLMAFYQPRENKKLEPARTATACDRLGNLLIRYGGDSPTAMIDLLDRATASGWKSVYPPSNSSQNKPPTTREDVPMYADD